MARRPHAPRDWAGLKMSYCRGDGTIAVLGPKFGIPQSTAEKRCAKEKWQVRRQEVGKRAEVKALAAESDSLAAMLARHKAVANLSLAIVAARVRQIAEVAAVTPDVLSDEEMDRLTKVVARMVPVERLASGIDRIRPVKPVEMADDDEIAFDVDLPSEAEEAARAPAAAPAKP